MKRKVLIICLVSFIISLIISCYTMYYYYDTRISNIYASNSKFEHSYYMEFTGDSLSYDKYCLMIICKLEDSLTKEVKHTAFLKSFSIFQDVYAYDPGKEFEYTLGDSIKAINIYSLYDFNELSDANSNLIDYFKIAYNVTYPMGRDSIRAKSDLKNWKQIHELFSDVERYSDNIALFMTLKVRPKYERQKFIVEFEYYSGKIMSDTARTIDLK